MKLPVLIIATLAPLLVSLNSLAQSCINTITPTTPTTHFQIITEGTVLDTKTGLMWMRCAIGQQWHNDQCHGELSILSWQEALVVAATIRFAKFDDWRLPNLHELSSITELKCQSPAANLQMFPNTAPQNYWTSTTFVNSNDNAWLVHFDVGENHTANKNRRAHARLVRRLKP